MLLYVHRHHKDRELLAEVLLYVRRDHKDRELLAEVLLYVRRDHKDRELLAEVLLYVRRNRRLIREPRTSTLTFTQLLDDVELNVLGCRVDILGANCDQCMSMVQCSFTSTETIRLIRTGSPRRPPRLSHSS